MATQLSAAQSSTDETLSGGNLTATSSGAGTAVASRVLTSALSYFEFVATTFGGTMSVGVVTSSFNPSGNTPGADANGCGFQNTGAVVIAGATVATIQSYAAGARIGVAVNIQLGLIWFTTNGTTWNNAAIGSQNPAGNVGGISLATMNGGSMCPAAGSTASGAVFTAAFSSGSFAYTPPTGYASADACGVSLARNSSVQIGASYSTLKGASPEPVTPAVLARASTLGMGQQPGQFSPAGAVTHVAGSTAEGGVPAPVTVRAYDSATGQLLSSATSGAGGAFSLPALGRAAVDLVAKDPANGKVQIYQAVNPA